MAKKLLGRRWGACARRQYVHEGPQQAWRAAPQVLVGVGMKATTGLPHLNPIQPFMGYKGT